MASSPDLQRGSGDMEQFRVGFWVLGAIHFPFLDLSGLSSSRGGNEGSCHGWVLWWYATAGLVCRACSVIVVVTQGLFGSERFWSLRAVTKGSPVFNGL